jgi:glycosyltransferase involved in cell wall biosynthesis
MMPDRPLRLCFFAPVVRAHRGYFPPHTAIVSGFLAAMGHEVTILSGQLPDGRSAIETEGGVTTHFLPDTPATKTGGPFWENSARAFDRLHAEQPFDAVFGRGTATWGFFRFSRFAAQVPVILHEGTYPKWLHQIESRARAWLAWLAYPLAPLFALTDPKLHQCLRGASRVVCITPELARAFRRIAWWRPPRTLGLTYGFDVSRYHPRPPDPLAPPRLVSLGRLTWDKGILPMIDVLARLQNRRAVLEAMGPASPRIRQAVLSRAARRGVADRYLAPGVVQHEEVPDRLAGAVAFLFPSTHAEGLGKVVLEAMASGVPVVAYRLPVLEGIIEDGVNGFVVPIRSVRAMAERVDQVLADPALQARMAAAARKKIETAFTPEAIRGQWQALLAEVVAEARARSL